MLLPQLCRDRVIAVANGNEPQLSQPRQPSWNWANCLLRTRCCSRRRSQGRVSLEHFEINLGLAAGGGPFRGHQVLSPRELLGQAEQTGSAAGATSFVSGFPFWSGTTPAGFREASRGELPSQNEGQEAKLVAPAAPAPVAAAPAKAAAPAAKAPEKATTNGHTPAAKPLIDLEVLERAGLSMKVDGNNGNVRNEQFARFQLDACELRQLRLDYRSQRQLLSLPQLRQQHGLLVVGHSANRHRPRGGGGNGVRKRGKSNGPPVLEQALEQQPQLAEFTRVVDAFDFADIHAQGRVYISLLQLRDQLAVFDIALADANLKGVLVRVHACGRCTSSACRWLCLEHCRRCRRSSRASEAEPLHVVAEDRDGIHVFAQPADLALDTDTHTLHGSDVDEPAQVIDFLVEGRTNLG